MSYQSSDNNIEQKEASNVEKKDTYEVIEKFAQKPSDSMAVANFSNKPVEMVSEKNDNSDIYRNPIFDEKLPDTQTTDKKTRTNGPNATNKFMSVIILGGLLLLGLLAGGGFFYYKLSKSANPLASATTTTIAEAEWVEYVAPENKFVMLFPKEADVAQNTVSLSETVTVDVTYVSASSNATSYLLQSSTIPDSIDISNPEEFYQGILSGMLGDENKGEIISDTKTEFLGGEGLEYLIKIDGRYTKGKIILIGRDWYLLAVNSDTKTPVDYNKFVDSLTLSDGE
jgi:flagellar basal body-associated protein FliL